MFLIATVFVPATAFAAGSGTLSLSQAAITTTTGSTFSVDVQTQASVALSGAAASIDFDRTKLQIVSVTRGADWNVAGTAWVDATVSTIAIANSTGHLSAVSAFFTDGTSSITASTNKVLATVTFFAIATGASNITLPSAVSPSLIVPSDYGSLIDGTVGAATYGTPVTTVSSGSAVTVNAGTQGNASTTANVTGSVDSGYVSLTCPTSVTVPLVRNVVNTKEFTCIVGSNVTWTLSTQDNNAAANHGHLVDATQTPTAVLADPLHVVNGGQALNVDLSAQPGLATIATGQNNVNQLLTFSQNVRPSDKPGAYGLSVLFSLTSTF
jgi:hypothetical protein